MKFLKIFFYLVFLLTPLFPFSQEVSSNIMLTGFDTKNGFIIYCNDYYGENSSPISFYGATEKKVFIQYPTLFYTADLTGTPFLILPGENISIKKDGKNFIAEVTNSPIRNNELKLLKDIIIKLGPIYGIGATDNIPVPISYFKKEERLKFEKYKKYLKTPATSFIERDSIISSIYIKRKKFVETYSLNFKISDSFKNYIQNYFLYSYLDNSISGYLNTKAKMSIKLKEDLSKADLIDKNQNLLSIDRYRSFITNYNLILSGDTTSNFTDYKTQMKSALKNFKESSKDYLIYTIAKNSIRKSYDSVGMILNVFFSQCSNEKFRKRIELEKDLWNLQQSDNSEGEIITGSMKKMSLLTLVKEVNAEFILIDFWASWCRPCIAEMQFEKQLQKKFANVQRIKFIYISLDNSINEWKKSIKKYSELMNVDNSYLLLNSFFSDFAKRYKIQTIPRYMIINSKGEILNLDAPRPSDKKLQNLINNYLTQ